MLKLLIDFIESKYNLKDNLLDLFFIILIILIAILTMVLQPFVTLDLKKIVVGMLIIRNFLSFYKNIGEDKKNRDFSKKMATHPAKTLITSYLFLIFLGTLLLMLPISTYTTKRIGFIDALFTVTSAISVTGLTVFNVGVDLTPFGQVVILLLIQVGGLGIMIFSYLTGFAIGKKLSIEERTTISFAMNESDFTSIKKNVKNIILITFSVEIVGMVLLFFKFIFLYDFSFKTFFFSLFHSVSAFCNSGFSLYSNSLYDFRDSIFLNIVITSLIIMGSLSFIVIIDIYKNLKTFINNQILKKHRAYKKLEHNTIVVLTVTTIMIVSGTLLFYIFEHNNTLLNENIITQYLMSFFQSVSVRTTGFNTADNTALKNYTYFLFLAFMFIGGASGGTSGGVKVNTIGVLFVYLKSIVNNQNKVVLLKKSISKETITKSFLIVTFGIIIIFVASIVLLISEPFSLTQILFETTSAFSTSGISTGITSSLTNIGKIVIMVLMFIGKVGPLTILLLTSQKTDNAQVEYPEAEIKIG